MSIRFFHIDTFCDQQFQGNPAAVCLLPTWFETAQLQCLAAEQHKRAPDSISRAYLKCIAKNPKIIEQLVNS